MLRAISFTGSNEVGGALYAKSAQRGAKVTCEMGGKNAVIVMADADLDKAAIAIHGGAFGSTGQRCTATSRVIAASGRQRRAARTIGRRRQKNQNRPGIGRDQSTWDRRWTTNNGRRISTTSRSASKKAAADSRRQTRRSSWQRLLRRTDDLRQRHADHAHLQGRNLRPGAFGSDGEESSTRRCATPTASSTA